MSGAGVASAGALLPRVRGKAGFLSTRREKSGRSAGARHGYRRILGGGGAKGLSEFVRNKSDFKRIVQFAIDEYKALLKSESIDDKTRARVEKKVAGLSSMIAEW